MLLLRNLDSSLMTFLNPYLVWDMFSVLYALSYDSIEDKFLSLVHS